MIRKIQKSKNKEYVLNIKELLGEKQFDYLNETDFDIRNVLAILIEKKLKHDLDKTIGWLMEKGIKNKQALAEMLGEVQEETDK